MAKRIIATIAVLVVLGFTVYALAWPYDLKIRFEAEAYPGVVRQTLQTWSDGLGTSNTSGPEVQSELLGRPGDIFEITQLLNIGERELTYRWSIGWATDSSSRVEVKISEKGKRLANRLSIPFSQTDFEQESQERVKDFYDKLQEHLSKFRVEVQEVEELASTYTAYVPVACKQYEKASFMMKNYPMITNLIIEHEIETNGIPFVEITRWNEEEDSIYFNFCYPIIRSEKLPIGTPLQYKRFFGKKALKARYNGNYIFSDRAWYALRKKAEERGLDYEEKPVEFFFSNPNFGGDELEWKAEIFLPVKD